ncbi:MAG: UPF0262 family protein [Rhizobiales bacterium]|nr:UPF0262 family protein [Hyphomicrobiales bacterium]
MAENRLVDISLDTRSIGRATPDIEHERDVAIYDLLEENQFAPVGSENGPFKLVLSIAEKRLVFDILDIEDGPAGTFILSLSPLRRVIKDYFLICESYFSAIKTSAPSQIEAIDMGRRGLHDEGTQILLERLDGKVDTNFETARRLFTLICVLHWRG